MESSPASVEVKGSRQAEEREREEGKIKKWRSRRGHEIQTTREGEHAPKSRNADVGEVGRLLYQSKLLPREVPLSLNAWRAGKLTAGRTDRSPSSQHCKQEHKRHFCT